MRRTSLPVVLTWQVIVPSGQASTVTAPVGGELRAGLDHPAPLISAASVVRGEVQMPLISFVLLDRAARARATCEVTANGSAFEPGH